MKKQTTVKDRTYLLKGKSPLSLSIASRDSARFRLLYHDTEANEGKGANRALRYAKNQNSPFQDQQDDTAILEPIVFEDGKLMVQKTNPVLQEFLSYHPGNVENGGSEFYEFDPEKVAQQNIENLNLEVDALIAVRSLDINTMKSIGRVHLNGNVDKMTSSELKHDILLFAKQNPREFLDAIDDPELGVSNMASRALSEGYIQLRGGKDLFYALPDNKKKIMTIPFGQKPEDALSEWLHSDKGKDFFVFLSENLKD